MFAIARILTRPFKQPIAFCWLHGWELGKEAIFKLKCIEPGKQTYGKCEHLMYYGEKKEAIDIIAIQTIYERMISDLAANGVRLEGRNINLVQVLPGGARVRLSLEVAEKIRRDKFRNHKKVCNHEEGIK